MTTGTKLPGYSNYEYDLPATLPSCAEVARAPEEAHIAEICAGLLNVSRVAIDTTSTTQAYAA